MKRHFIQYAFLAIVLALPSLAHSTGPFDSLVQARGRALDARITANLGQLRVAAERYYDTGENGYLGIAGDKEIARLMEDVRQQEGSAVEWGKITEESYAAWAPLVSHDKANRAWCVDSLRIVQEVPYDAVVEGETEKCPAPDAPPAKNTINGTEKNEGSSSEMPVIVGIVVFLEIVGAVTAFFFVIRKRSYPHDGGSGMV